MKLEVGTRVLLNTVGGVRPGVVAKSEPPTEEFVLPVRFIFTDNKPDAALSTTWAYKDCLKDCVVIPDKAKKAQIEALIRIIS